MVGPKTMFGARAEPRSGVAAAPGVSLGWLVVLRSVDAARVGQIFELESDEVVLSRARVFSGTGGSIVALDDDFMSGGHAVVRRPRTLDKSDAFTLRDRRDPGPSANGTFVNAHKLGRSEEARLADGDIIKVGTTELLFKSLWLPPDGARPWG
jgi:FHA domain-containing protein